MTMGQGQGIHERISYKGVSYFVFCKRLGGPG